MVEEIEPHILKRFEIQNKQGFTVIQEKALTAWSSNLSTRKPSRQLHSRKFSTLFKTPLTLNALTVRSCYFKN